MYLDYYKLHVSPFQISTNPEFLWLGDKHREAMATLRYGILDNKGFLLLTGDVGTGKTTLINALLQSLDENVMVVSISDPAMEQLDLFHYIARIFGIQSDFSTKGEFLILFSRFLNDAYERGKKVVLIIDEAQRLTPELLEEIRLLSNIERPDTKLINIFFVGQNEFNSLISREENRAIRQRITVSYEIPSLSLKETGDYLSHRLKVAGAERDFFTVGAIKQIHAFSRGYPRLINIIADRALLTGFVHEIKEIGPKVINDCAKELRIPVPEFAAEFWRDPGSAGLEPAGASSFFRQLAAPIMTRFAGGKRDRREEEAGKILGAKPLESFPASPLGGLPQTPASADGERRKLRVRETPLPGDPGGKPFGGPLPAEGAEGFPWAIGLVTLLGIFLLIFVVKFVIPDSLIEQLAPDSFTYSGGGDSEPPDDDQAEQQGQEGADQAQNQQLASPDSAETTPPTFPGDGNLLNRRLVVLFGADSNVLPGPSINLLAQLSVQLKSTDYERVVVRAYSDRLGPETYNRRFTEHRAAMVKGHLRGLGIPPDTVLAMGMGSYGMIAASGAPDARQLNGRVEIEIIR